jgi:DNA-binding transcriptional MerR regulator
LLPRKTCYSMETRILTLFDDEAFFPKEPPKEKPTKEKQPKPAAATDLPLDAGKEATVTPETASDIIEENEVDNAADIALTTIANPSVAENTDAEGNNTETANETVPSLEESLMATPEDDDSNIIAVTPTEADTITPIEQPSNTIEADMLSMEDAQDAALEEALIIDIPAIDTSHDADTETEEPILNPEDKELNQQILSELIQLDYTALMQKDYAFDLNNAKVIHKELPKKEKDREPLPIEEEEEITIEEEEVYEDVAPLPEWKLDKKYYTIGEVAQLFEVNTSHIRFWTNEFKLRPRTTRKGDRLYSPKDIAELRLIHHLVKVKKHTIKGAKEKLKAEKSDVNNKLDLKESLMQLKDTLLKIRSQL